ncbi:hypothetical protein L1F30_01320 [Simiduia sp. 21SJ11W-1]|uniref:hypothetical protein n=1 Tax=Simiduia sp. 21SJ11W-1 TaxID=2909669 RepID=UPI0020A09176|nr:hypothetical protein [Simiduia sp. 21SJ11W-1]UTA48194.1 hypothetical protein L1F30_01320 [Simiduia sp. 21SJ11W-1]
MPIQIVETGAGEKEVHFASRQDAIYPHLMRLCMDFNFRVVEHGNQFSLAPQEAGSITPAFNDLDALEAHVHQHMVDILHDYLCSDGALTH